MSTALGGHALTGTYTLDPARTRVGFIARHTIGPAVRGSFERLDGAGRLDADDVSGSRVDLTIDAASIRTGNERRDAHLRAKFLDAEQHRAISFTSTAAEQRENGGYRVTGDLTIRGLPTSLTLDFEPAVPGDSPTDDVRLTASHVVARHDLGVVWSSVWDRSVAEQVTLQLEVALTADGASKA